MTTRIVSWQQALFWVVALLLAAEARAQTTGAMSQLINACSSALVIDKVAKTDDAFTQLSLTSLFGQETAKSMGASGGGNYGVISGHGSYNKNDTSNTTAVSGSTYSNEEMSSYIAAKLSDSGAREYGHCLDSVFGSPGLHLNVVSYDADQATIHIKYIPQSGTDTSNMRLRLLTNGGVPGGQGLLIQPSGYDSDMIFNVFNPSKSLRILVIVLQNWHQVTSASTVLPIITRTVNDVFQNNMRSPVSSALCGGYHSTDSTSGPTVSIGADAGYAIDQGTISFNREAIPGNRRSSPNNWYDGGTLGPKIISANTKCVVPDGNNFYAAAISISATETKHLTYLQLPNDNGKAVMMRLVTP
ncbi:MAG: hypothetical protein ACRYG4_09035 [Janthinobacterium lividum]